MAARSDRKLTPRMRTHALPSPHSELTLVSAMMVEYLSLTLVLRVQSLVVAYLACRIKSWQTEMQNMQNMQNTTSDELYMCNVGRLRT